MSIVVKFSMGPRKNWFQGTLWNQDTAEELAKNLALDMGYHCNVMQGYLIFQFCPEGFLWMTWEQGKIVGDCQTNIAGPGFHAAVIHFLELFALRGEFKLHIEDRTGYVDDRNFEKLRRDYFFVWFKELLDEVLEKADQKEEQLLCWPANYYLPEEQKGTVMTHIRRFTRDEIYRIVHSGVSMGFAKDFFIWNEEEKDAYFYRNCALVLLNQECYFMPSDRSQEDYYMNKRIIKLLEKAMKADRGIPFPIGAYLEVCQLDEHEALDMAGVYDMEIPVQLGCRKGLLYRTIGNIRFAVPGNFQYDAETTGNAERYYDGRKTGWHDFYICGVSTTEKAGFWESTFSKDTIQSVIDFQVGDANGKIAVYHAAPKKNTLVYTVSAQVIYQNQTTVISIQTDEKDDLDWAINLIKKIQTIA